MLRHFKERAWHNRGSVLLAQQFEECFRIAVGEAREKHRSCERAAALEIAPRIEKGFDQRAIGGEQRPRSLAKLRQVIKGDYGHALGSVGRNRSEQTRE